MGEKRTTSAARTPAARRARTTSAPKKKAHAKAKAKAKAKAPAKRSARTKVSRPTLATISAQLDALREQILNLEKLVWSRSPLDGAPSRRATIDGIQSSPNIDRATFEADLLAIVAELDRAARHAGMVPIPEVRNVFLGRGWSRSEFDARLLDAEREFIIDLKSANDPARLSEPEQAIQEPGRGYLQYVVTR